MHHRLLIMKLLVLVNLFLAANAAHDERNQDGVANQLAASVTSTNSQIVTNPVFNFSDFEAGVPRIYSPNATTDPDATRGTIQVSVKPSTVGKIDLYYQNPNTSDTMVAGQVLNPSETPSPRNSNNDSYFTVEIVTGDLVRITLFPATASRKFPSPGVYYFSVTMTDDTSLFNSQAFGITDTKDQDPNNVISSYGANANILSNTEAVPIESDRTSSSGTEITRTTNIPSESADSIASDNDGSGTSLGGSIKNDANSGGGLAVGAIVGIAIGAFVAVVAVLAIIWFMMCRRKRSNMSSHPDASTPLATGYHNAAVGRSGDFIGEKEAGAMAIAESPRSQMYTDQPEPLSNQGTALATGAAGAAGFTEGGHQAYDAGSTSAPGADHTMPSPPPPGENSGRAVMNSPVPSTAVARHLVDPDMTEEDIRRLEEEERELDRQIQEARKK